MSILRYEDINWSVPVLFSHDEYILSISSLMKRLDLRNPITYAYGMVPSLWTGGRYSQKLTQDKEKISELLKMVINAGSVPTFTFSKYNITQEELGDEFCNWLLDFGVENNCNFIMTSDLLYNHIKSKYPNAKCVASVLKPIFELELQNLSETDYYNMLLEKFDRVVVRPEYSLKTLLTDYQKISDISRIEVLVNQVCVQNCTYAQKEHLFIPESDWSIFNNKPIEKNTYCPRVNITDTQGLKGHLKIPTLMFTEEEMDNLVYNIGIKNLKLQGRNYSPIDNTRMINNYLFENIGEFQNITPIIWGQCEEIKRKGVLPV